ncbi:cellulose binding domain-containing protein [Streptomyces sp. NPDC060322]|uniref:cellulose binding domain-containing protein n=1 Tax=Streptomyces sp. NPDC060322 TaxID=3347097 RepID=UPI0036647754
MCAFAVTQAWNATITPPSGTVRAVDAGFDRRIAAGVTQSFGFQGTWSGAYAEAARFARNGAACTVA